MELGASLGPYRIERELGVGGMGKVYAATVEGPCPGLERGACVALKVVHPHLLETVGFFKRFLREAQVGQSIRHENVVRTLDCDAVGGAHFLVMEYVEGQTLHELQREFDRVPEELCRHVAREVCKGLAAIHAAGVVHRDLKPENVIIALSAARGGDDDAARPSAGSSSVSRAREGNVQPQYDHVVKIMDLGVARLADEALRLSQSGAFIGSVAYAAPEQFGGDVDHRCDLHGLGVLLYEIATGQHPYRADSFHVAMKRIREEAPRRLGEVNPQLSPLFEEVVHTLLAKSRDDRFPSADVVLRVLEEGEDSAWWRDRVRALRIETRQPLRRIRIPRETAVYGREQEITKLRGLFERAKAGAGRVLLIEGEAGIGKSRLVDELVARLQQDGEDLHFLFGSYPPGGAATAAGGFSTAYREQFGDAGSSAYLTKSPALVAAFDALLRGEPTPKGEEALTKDSLQTCFVNATRALAAARVTVVLIDDLHFAPEEGRALFTSLAMAVPGHPVLLIGTTRPGVSDDWIAGLTRLDETEHLDLHRLGPKDLVKLLQETLKSKRLALALGGQIAIKSDGNPFFVFEILRGLRDGQFLTQSQDGSWVGTKVLDAIQIPSTVLDLVNARVSDLTEDERNLLDVAACCGFEFDPLIVGEVLDMARVPLLRALGQIERRHRLVRASGRRYVFDHHQVQESLYGSLSELLREEYHAAIADALETRTNASAGDPEELDGALCVNLCNHFLAGARNASVLRYLPGAQSHLAGGYLYAEVVALTERALAVPRLLTGAERGRTFLRLGESLDQMGRWVRQEECARDAERLALEAGDEGLRGDAAQALGVVLLRTSRYDEAETAFRRAQEIAQALGDRKAEATAIGNLGSVHQSRGRLPEARECRERARALYREVGDRIGEAVSIGNLGTVLKAASRLPEAREQFERYGEFSREIGFRRGVAGATGNLANVLYAEGRLREARELFERHLALACEMGDRRGEAIATGNLGALHASEGRLSAALEHHEQHLALVREIGYRRGEAIALHNLGIVRREQGAHAQSEERFVECLALGQRIGIRQLVAITHLALGSLRAAAGDEERARGSFVAARDLAAEVGAPGVGALARCELACLPGGDADEALADLREHEHRLDADERRRARWLLWKATGDSAHLEEAKRLLDEATAGVDAETRESMLANLRINRVILESWNAHGGAAAGD